MTDTMNPHEWRNRERKAADAVDAIFLAYADDTAPTPDAIDALDDDGWRNLAALVSAGRGGRPVDIESAASRESVRRAYRARVEYRARLAAMTDEELFDVN